ncbi:MAG: DNA repair protein RadA, partial [Saprospiraceae bacterium]
VGLSGEIRPVQQVDLRVAEAIRLGYKKIYVPAGSQLESNSKNNIVVKVRLLRELFEDVFG